MSAAEFFVPLDAVLSLGLPAAGATATFYLAGTTTKTPVYTSAALSTTHSNPVVADAAGVLPTIYLDSTISYRVLIRDILGGTIKDVDNYIPGTYLAHQGLPGVNGGTASNLTIGLFTGANGQSLAGSPEVVFTSGYRVTGRGGARYVKDAAVDAAFVTAHPRWSFRSSQGVGYRLSEDENGEVPFGAFGAYGDWNGTVGTDDLPAWVSYLDYAATYATIHNNAYYKSVPTLRLDRLQYYSSDSWDLKDGVHDIRGTGPVALDVGGNTQIVFAAGKSGLRAQSWDTTGDTGTTTNTPKGSAYSHISDISVFSLGGTLGAAQHGFLFKAPVTGERLFAYNFGGYAHYIAADVTYAGNANCGKLTDCGGLNCGSGGVGTIGGDANAWEIKGYNAVSNMGYGIDEQSFLGNHYYGFHTSGNGIESAGPFWAPYPTSAATSYSGHYYRVIAGQETGASTHAPSGTTASNTWWTYVGDGAAIAAYPPWVSGRHYKAGGAFLINGASNKTGVFGGYMESNQLGGLCFSLRALIIAGGFSNWIGPSLNAHDGRLWTSQLGMAQGSGDGIEITATQVQFSSTCYIERRTNSEVAQMRGPLDASISWNRNGSSAQRPYSMDFPAGISTGTLYIGSGSAAPTTGTWSRGDRVNNDGSATTLGTTDHWVCSVAGTPGTWIAKA